MRKRDRLLSPLVHSVSAVDLQLTVLPLPPFDVAAHAIKTRMEGQCLSSRRDRPSLLVPTHERRAENIHEAMAQQSSYLRELGLSEPVVSAGLADILIAQLRSMGREVHVNLPLFKPERFITPPAYASPLTEFITDHNRGEIVMHGELALGQAINQILRAFPSLQIAIVTIGKSGAENIVKAIEDDGQENAIETSATTGNWPRVSVGTCSQLERRLNRCPDLLLVTEPRICAHVEFAELLAHGACSLRIFLLTQSGKKYSDKNWDRVVPAIGFDSISVDQAYRVRSELSVTHTTVKCNIGTGQGLDEVDLVRLLEKNRERNKKIAKIARSQTERNPTGEVVVLCAAASHAKALARYLPGWTVVTESDGMPNGPPSLSAPSGAKLICTMSVLRRFRPVGEQLTVLWAGSRPNAFQLPEALRWPLTGNQGLVEVIDIQDFIFVGNDSNDKPKGQNPSAEPFDPIKTVRCWNQCRIDQYETEWGPPSKAKRVENALRRLVIKRRGASRSSVSATPAEVCDE